MEERPGGERRPGTLIGLTRSLVNDAAELVRQEIGLFKAEVAAKLRAVGRHLSQVAVGGGVASLGILAFAAFMIVGLGALLGGSYWLAALIVSLVLLAGGGGMVYLGARRIGKALEPPRHTLEAARETGAWAGEEIGNLRAALTGGDRAPALPERSAGRGTAGTALAPTIPGGEESAQAGVPARAGVAGSPVGSGRAQVGEARGGRRSSGRSRLPVSAPVFRRILREIGEDDVLGQAAKVAFFMFLSLPPALMVLFGLTGIFGGEEVARYLTTQIQSALPGSADEPNSAAALVSEFVDQVVNENAPGPLSLGLLLGLWSSSAVFVATTEALNMAYDVREERSWVHRRTMAVGVMFVFLLLFLSGSVLLIAGPAIAEVLPFGEVGILAWKIAQWPLAFLLVVAALFLVYYVLPNRDQKAAKWVLFKSSVISGLLWLIATMGFRVYIANFGSYSDTYGFVGAILVLLLWMYMTGVVLLVGGEIGSEMERTA